MLAADLTHQPAVQAQALPAQQQGAAKRGDLQRTAVVAAPPAPTQPTVASTESKKTTQGPIIMNGQVWLLVSLRQPESLSISVPQYIYGLGGVGRHVCSAGWHA